PALRSAGGRDLGRPHLSTSAEHLARLTTRWRVTDHLPAVFSTVLWWEPHPAPAPIHRGEPVRPPLDKARGARRCARVGMSVGAAAALVLTLAAPAATADTSDPEHLGSASDLGVDVPETTPELSSEFATSRTGAWFVELEEEPVTRGGDLRIMAQARRDITTEARSAGVDLDVRQTFTRLWNGISANIDDEDIDVIRDLDQVKAVYPVLPIDAPQSPVSDKDLVYALSMTGADIAQSELGYTGEGLKVGIIDTGVDYDHPDLGGSGVDGETSFPTDKVVAGRDFVGDDYNADPEDPAYQPVPMPDPDPDDCHGHGTHVAGIVAADGDVDAGGVR